MFQPEELDRPRPEDFAAPFFFFSTRGVTRLSYVSPSMRAVLGHDPVKLLGVSYLDLLIQDDPLNADLCDCGDAEIAPGTSRYALRAVRNADGKRRVLSIQMTAIADQPVRMHCIAHDVTEQWTTTLHIRERLQQLRSKLKGLSDRDRVISEAAVRGRSNESVANELEVSVRTVERSRHKLRERFGVSHVSEIVSLFSECQTLERLWALQSNEPWRNAANVRL